MYYQHFGLSGPPFASSTSPAPLFLSAGHREGLAALQWGLREPSGFTMLVGEIGTGKTTLIHSLLDDRHEGVRVVAVSNPKLSFEEMLRVITAQLGVKPAGSGKLDLIEALDGFLAGRKADEPVALIFDEAQDIGDETLEELRLLSNSQTAGQRRLQIVLVGQLELARRLARPELRQLNQRIGARALLPTLRPAEVYAYAEYRLRAAQGDIRKLFNRGAVRELARSSAGIPRRINVLCHNALLLAYAQQAARVSAANMREAARDYDNLLAGCDAASSSAGLRRGLPIKAALAGGLAIALLGASYFIAPRVLSTIYMAAARRDVAPRVADIQPVSKTAAADDHMSEAHKEASGAPAAVSGAAASADLPTVADQDLVKVSALSAAPKPELQAASLMPVEHAEAEKVAPADAAQAEKAAPQAAALSARVPTVSPVSAAPEAGTVKPPGSVVTVHEGDTLSKIVQRRYGSTATNQLKRRLAELVHANPQIANANQIYPGQIIHLKELSK
ncbi:MAG TPA: AAA family ATPase [Candidatus Binataceae bacterium]|nr:AAA family ATPase [Candidatus Binataceae bacterium]